MKIVAGFDVSKDDLGYEYIITHHSIMIEVLLIFK